MSVDKFGHYSGELVTGSKIQRGPPGEGFKLTKDGNFNINNKRLCNVGDPKTDNEAVNVKYVKQNSITLSNTSNHFDVKMKKITNLADPQEPFDAVNKIYCENTMKTSLINRIPVKVKDGSVYSFKNNRVTNVASPISKLDVVNVETILLYLIKKETLLMLRITLSNDYKILKNKKTPQINFMWIINYPIRLYNLGVATLRIID